MPERALIELPARRSREPEGASTSWSSPAGRRAPVWSRRLDERTPAPEEDDQRQAEPGRVPTWSAGLPKLTDGTGGSEPEPEADLTSAVPHPTPTSEQTTEPASLPNAVPEPAGTTSVGDAGEAVTGSTTVAQESPSSEQESFEDRLDQASPESKEDEEAEAAESESPPATTAGMAAPAPPEENPAPLAEDVPGAEAAAGVEAPVPESAPEPEATSAPEPAEADAEPETIERENVQVEARQEQEGDERVTAEETAEHDQEAAETAAESGQATAGGELSGGERDVGLAGLAEPVETGGSPAGPGGGGGGALPEPPKPAPLPDTSGMSPQAGLGAVAKLKPLQAAQALGGVAAAVDTAAQQEAEQLQALLPIVEVGGDGSGGSAVVQQSEAGTGDKVEKIEGGPSQPTPAPPPAPEPGPAPTAAIRTPTVADSDQGKIRPEDAQRVATAIDSMPTTDPSIDTSAGPAPQLERTGDADPALIGGQHAELDATIAEQRTQGAADLAAPAGEREVRDRSPRVAVERPSIAVPAGASRLTTPADDEAVGIIAEEKQGAQVRAEIAKAQGGMASEQEAHRAKVSEEKTKSDVEIATAKAENARQQQDEKNRVAAEVGEARAEWSSEQSAKVKETNDKATQEVARTEAEISTEETKGDQDADAELRKGEVEAREAKQTAERDAAAKKQEAERRKAEESGGIFGWIASKVTSFFNALKDAITKVFDLAKALVKKAIDAAKKAALAVIERARKAVVGLIKAVGAALIALGDVLLAAFPSLRKKWRAFIEDKVRKAEAAVNKLADALKKGITKLLDALGKAFEFLLDLYQKGLLAVVGIAQKAALAAVNAAKAIAAAIGAWVGIIKDIAASPVAWIRNLGAAAIDGVKNHLWKAFKKAVKEWFDAKLEEVLGLGTAIWNVLKNGGIAIADIARMVFEALKSAIPTALIQLLIEKLVAMIIPAAGAVLAIIEGLQAAWGTVQRMLSAFGKFIAFLKAVAKGGAGPQFADLLAAAAIVVIDFVSNWLLRRLVKPASKVGGKIKAIAQKILAKLKKVAKKAVTKLKRAFRKVKKKVTDWRKKRQARKDAKRGKDPKAEAARRKKAKEQAKQNRLERAVKAIGPAAEAMFRRGVGSLRLKVQLGYWRLRYRLTSLKLESGTLVARVNPSYGLTKAQQLELGAALEPILQAAEAQYLAEYEAAREKEARGEDLTEDDPLRHHSTETQLWFLRAASTGEGVSWGTSKKGARYVGKAAAPNGVEVTSLKHRGKGEQSTTPGDVRANLVTTVIPMRAGRGGDSYHGIAKKERALEISEKTDTILELEGARKAGMSSALDLSWATAEAQLAATPEEKRASVSRRLARENLTTLNPMAPKKAASAASTEASASGASDKKKRKLTKKEKLNRNAIAERKRRVAQIFLRMREMVRTNKDVFGDRSAALAGVAEAFRQWLDARKLSPSASDEQLEALKAKLVVFLKNYKR